MGPARFARRRNVSGQACRLRDAPDVGARRVHKLLRSVSDGQVFDLIPIVADRYLRGRGRKDLQVWKPNRHLHSVPAGSVLRIVVQGHFRLRWSCPQWQVQQEVASNDSGLDLGYVDISTRPGPPATIRFSFTDATSSSLPKDTVFEVRVQPNK